MKELHFLYFTVILIVAELLYFRMAGYYNIIDKPNHRSSHTTLTVRGGGIIFVLSILLYPILFPFQLPYFLLGLLIISAISFLDDLRPVSSLVRIICQLIAISLFFYQLHLFDVPIYSVFAFTILAVGIINAVNFMDGINGITGAYALITLITLLYINEFTAVKFTTTNLIIAPIIAVMIFNYFNFRRNAMCFAGDIGSVGIAFIILFNIAQLIQYSGNFAYFLLLLIYGLDTSTTVFFRMMRKERLFEAHRSHFYQFLANEKKLPHLVVASIYAMSQALVNILIIFYSIETFEAILLTCIILLIGFLGLRFYLEGKTRLFRD